MTIKNLPASVHARLLDRARATKRPFQELLQYYAMERFLYRLSRSPHSARFVLKGALMLYVWDAPLARATKDVDLLGRLDNSLENLARVVHDICVIEVEPDGITFDAATIVTARIKEDADYQGVRVTFTGYLGKAKSTMQLDVGFWRWTRCPAPGLAAAARAPAPLFPVNARRSAPEPQGSRSPRPTAG